MRMRVDARTPRLPLAIGANAAGPVFAARGGENVSRARRSHVPFLPEGRAFRWVESKRHPGASFTNT